MIKFIEERIKKNNGFTGQDIIIATFIILLFLSLLSTLIINLSNTSSQVSKVKILTETLTKVADKIDSLAYDEISVTTEEKSITELDIFNDLKLNKNMNITYQVEEDELQARKTIKIIAKYSNVETVDITIGKRIVEVQETASGEDSSEGTSASKIQINTNAQYPFNRPNHELEDATLTAYQYGNGKSLVPIKFVWSNVSSYSKRGAWVTTTEDDLEWYSIEENIWPTFAYAAVQKCSYIGIQGYSNNKEYKPNTVLRYNPFQNDRNSTSDSKYAFIWLPRVLRTTNTIYQGNNAQYFYAYEKLNNKLIYSTSTGYIADTTATLVEYNDNLYNNSYTKYERGALIGYNSKEQREPWDSILSQSVPQELVNNIQNIDKHNNDYDTSIR